MNYISEKDINKLNSETGKKLQKEPKVRIMIGKDGMGDFWEGGINGHFFRIKKGQAVDVPQSLATLIEQNTNTMRLSEELVKEYKNGSKRVG